MDRMTYDHRGSIGGHVIRNWKPKVATKIVESILSVYYPSCPRLFDGCNDVGNWKTVLLASTPDDRNDDDPSWMSPGNTYAPGLPLRPVIYGSLGDREQDIEKLRLLSGRDSSAPCDNRRIRKAWWKEQDALHLFNPLTRTSNTIASKYQPP